MGQCFTISWRLLHRKNGLLTRVLHECYVTLVATSGLSMRFPNHLDDFACCHQLTADTVGGPKGNALVLGIRFLFANRAFIL